MKRFLWKIFCVMVVTLDLYVNDVTEIFICFFLITKNLIKIDENKKMTKTGFKKVPNIDVIYV